MTVFKQKSSLSTLCMIAIASGFLSGCEDRMQEAVNEMDAIKASPAQPVEPPPEPVLVKDYVYDPGNVRSPFLPQSLVNRQEKIESIEGVRPDVTRAKEPLEKFELSQMAYKGMLVTPNNEKYGLIQRPDGLIDSVKVGDYMGVNDGQVVEITSTQINLIEIVPDSRAGFVEKPAALISP